jgi:peptidoglycan/LPS O-acetylase OafA/YrhL
MKYLFGMGLPFAIYLLLILILRRKKESPIVYDEMQKIIRGSAYKYSTISGVLGGFIAAFLVDLGLIPMDGSFAMMTISFLMITVYIVYMVMKGAYFGISGNWKRWTAIIFLIGLCNFCSGIFYLIAAGLPTGKLTSKNINIMMGAMFMVIVVAVMIQKLREKRNEDR